MVVAVGLATAVLSAPPDMPEGGSSPLDDVINGKIPLFRLDNVNGAVLPSQPSSYSCFTATRSPMSIHWEVNGSQALDRQQYEIFYSPMATIGPESKFAYARYSTLTIRRTAGMTVRCIVEQYDVQHPNRTPRFTLSTISTVARADSGSLHVTYGRPCTRHAPNCVTEHASCGMDIKPTPICLCDSSYRYLDQRRTCVALREHNSPCLLGYPCALPVDKCDGRCRCRPPFQQDASGCRMNTTLNSGCDQYRFCPEGAHCVNNVCACRPGYVPWGFGCLRRFLSGRRHAQGSRGHTVHPDCRVHRCHGVSRHLALPPFAQPVAHARALCSKLGVHAQDGSDIMRVPC
ncbi:hypothetical protein MTO96_006025 [Rhipicephalus appendiculatus]